MPKLAEAAVFAAGVIVDVSATTDYDTKQQDGVHVLLNTGEGFAKVKLNLDRMKELQPGVGQQVAWYLRYGATGGRERDASSYSSFVRVANRGDLERYLGLFPKAAA